MGSQRDGGGQPHISNTVIDSTADYLIQVGILHGDLNLTLRADIPPDETELRRAERRLASSLIHQWCAVADTWRMTDPAPLPVRWTPSDRLSRQGSSVAPRSGTDTMAGTFLGLEPRRLVILGTAGSGKTVHAVLLTIELLAQRLKFEEDVPVPVPLSLESWDTGRHAFDEWVEHRLRLDHPGLPFVDGAHPARRLVADRRVLPVLDGLDELPEHRRAEVLRALNHGIASAGGVVLVSRTAEYTQLDRSGSGLHGAAVIESLPLRAQDVSDHLTLVGRHTGTSDAWAPLARHLRDEPGSPVSQALTRPLMVWLLRATYGQPGGDTTDLVREERFASRAAVEEHLLDGAVHAAFPSLPSRPGLMHRPLAWDAGRAQGWLRYLARWMTRRRSSELAWWKLYAAPLPRVLAVPALLVVGIVMSLLNAALTPEYDSFLPTAAPLEGVLTVFIGRTLTEVWFERGLGEPRRSANPLLFLSHLRAVERHSRAGPLVRLAVLSGAPTLAALMLGLHFFADSDPALPLVALSFILAPLLMIVYAAPSDTVDTASPEELLRSEQSTLLGLLTTVAPLSGLGTGMTIGWEQGVASGLAASATLILLSPWSRWILAKSVMAVAGQGPWALMRFLKDARTAGLVQQTGGIYRFRNRRLQEHLAGDVPQRSALPIPAARSEDFTVVRDAHHFRLSGKSKRIPVAHWTGISLLTAAAAVRIAVTGQWHDPQYLVAVAVFPVLGILITAIGYALPPRSQDLELTREAVSATTGRVHVRYEWRHVEEIAVRRAVVRGRDGGFYALQVRLTADAPLPRRRLRAGAGWCFVAPLGFAPELPPAVDAALVDFAGARWRR
ncbi:NACHT domain-containing protein [Streptomyces sp. NPDC050095]|uniref:NACHT domain-containing protein n=1 Tax=unclassified Streptomyces TaxID=2593676 RepID=UPI00341988BD